MKLLKFLKDLFRPMSDEDYKAAGVVPAHKRYEYQEEQKEKECDHCGHKKL